MSPQQVHSMSAIISVDNQAVSTRCDNPLTPEFIAQGNVSHVADSFSILILSYPAKMPLAYLLIRRIFNPQSFPFFTGLEA